jgi:hypothetical protein
MRLATVILACALVSSAAPGGRRTQIRVPLWVESESGRTLTAGDLSATLGGNASRVLAILGPDDDLMVLAVLDLTGDLAYAEPAKEALVDAIRHLPPKTWVGAMRSQDGLKVLADPSPDRDAISEAVRAVPVSGKAGLLDTLATVEHIADTVLNKSRVRVAVLYLTDSDVQNYREDLTNPVINSSDSHDLSRRFSDALIQEKISKLSSTLSGGQTPLFIVHVRYRTDRLNEAYQNGLKELAELTGGAAFFCRSDSEMQEAVTRGLQLISTHYSVTLALPEAPHRNLQVQLEVGGGRSVSYRTRFVLDGKR